MWDSLRERLEASVCRHATFEVPPEPKAVPSTREFCRDTLDGWGLSSVLDDAQLILSELVTNGLLHAGTPLGVTVSAESGNVEVAVSDGSASVPEVRPQRGDLSGDLDELIAATDTDSDLDDRDPRLDIGAAGSVVGGRGLQLVVSLAQEWGVDRTDTGKSVWARLPMSASWPPTASCPCGGGGTRLSSGRTVVHAL